MEDPGLLSTRDSAILDLAVFYRGELFLRAVESRSGFCLRGRVQEREADESSLEVHLFVTVQRELTAA